MGKSLLKTRESIRKWGNFITKRGKYYEVEQVRTNLGNRYYKVGCRYYKVGQVYYKVWEGITKWGNYRQVGYC